MSLKLFTPEEVAILKANKYVKSITERQVVFTVEFKSRFWEEYQTGKMTHTIFADLGIDPSILGDRRIYGFTRGVVDTVKAGKSFRDGREKLKPREDDNDALQKNPILYMQHRINYLEQEIEFIKKIILLGKEKEQKCLSKKSLKQNTKSSEK